MEGEKKGVDTWHELPTLNLSLRLPKRSPSATWSHQKLTHLWRNKVTVMKTAAHLCLVERSRKFQG